MSHPRLEFLEPRTHLSVDATYANSWTNGPHLFIAVEYASESGIDTATLGNADVLVRRAGSAEFSTELAGVQQLDGVNRVRATYRMRAPGNWWDSGDNGAYTSVVHAGEVGDLGGAAVAQSDLHTNNLWFPNPFASMVSSTVTASTWLINVRFAGYLTGNPAGLGFRDGNLRITGPNGELASRLHQIQTIDGAIVATYSVAAPGGAWDTLETGQYAVALRGGQIYLLAESSLGHSNLWFGAPRVELVDANNDGAAISVRVRYESRAAMNLASLDDADLIAVASDGSEYAMVRAAELDAVDGNGFIAGYRLHGPGGVIAALPAGRYQFVVRGGEVEDALGYAPATHSSGSVGLVGTAAAATVSSAVPESGYYYATGENRGLLISINIRPELATATFVVGTVVADITTPHGRSISGTITSTHRLTDGTRQIVVAMLAPDVFLNYHDSGTYSVMLRDGFVCASGSTSMPSLSAGTFEFVNSNPRVEILGHRFTASDWFIDVRISDNDGINPGSFYSVMELFAATVTTASGNRNYRFMLTPTPMEPDGSYLATVRAFTTRSGEPDWRTRGQARLWMLYPVTDIHGNRAGFGQFATMPVSFDAPSAEITAAAVATEGVWDVAITFASPAGFEESAFRDGDLTATGPLGATLTSRLMSASRESDGSWTARYILTGEIAHGMHSITLVDGRAIDLAGNSTRGRTIGGRVTVIASASSPDAWATPDALVVRVDYANAESLDESSFGLDDLIVIRGQESLTPVRIDRIRRDASTWRVAYTFAPHGGAWSPEANGAWTASTVTDAVVRIDGTSVPARTVRTMNMYFAATPRLFSSTVTDTTWLVNIRFPGAIDTSSLGSGDLRILNRPDMHSSLHQIQFINGQVVATYSFTAPGGAWDFEDNGTYTVELLANAVRDAAGRSIAGLTFAPASLWFAQPAAYVADSFRTGGDWFIDVHYGGFGGMDAASLGDDDLVMERTGIAYSVTLMSWDAITRRARYRVNPVNGSWTTEDNGPYLLSVNANTVFGADGTAARARVIALLARPLN
jgi:hypothetical protein